MPEVYQPAEDSYFLSEVLSKIKIKPKDKILDMGSGSGIQAQNLIDRGINPINITIVDINPEAIYLLKRKFIKSEVIKSDLFNRLKGKFDAIIFNPPYLPGEKHDRELDTTGGKTGSEIINKFLIQAKNHLSKGGKIFLLISSLTKGINWQNFRKKLIAKKRIFMEELYIYELTR